MPQSIVQVDAFTDTPFTGNPAVVCLLPKERTVQWMQLVAREMNLSETAFLVRRSDEDGYDLRWFTPAVEVPLCGHATLASAHLLWEDGHLCPEELARFHTASGLLTARRDGDWIELDFPADAVTPVDAPPALLAAIGVPVVSVCRSGRRYVVELEDEEAVQTLAPDLGAIAALPVHGVVVTARAAAGPYDFVVRNFLPAAGIPEDPVTGAAQCSLAPYWSARLGKREFLAYQASVRGGVLRSRLVDDRVRISGQACIVLRGELLVH
jgi:PhzF family phenazine biosynthesis protein